MNSAKGTSSRRKGTAKSRATKGHTAKDAEVRAWRTEVRYFDSMRQKLWRKPEYRGKFVAVRQKEIVDMDQDRFVLYRRVRERFPGEVVLIEQVEIEPRKIELPGLEICR
jgi:hypothetical protein